MYLKEVGYTATIFLMNFIKECKIEEILEEVKILLPNLEVRLLEKCNYSNYKNIKLEINETPITLSLSNYLEDTIDISINNKETENYSCKNNQEITICDLLCSKIYNEYQELIEKVSII